MRVEMPWGSIEAKEYPDGSAWYVLLVVIIDNATPVEVMNFEVADISQQEAERIVNNIAGGEVAVSVNVAETQAALKGIVVIFPHSAVFNSTQKWFDEAYITFLADNVRLKLIGEQQ